MRHKKCRYSQAGSISTICWNLIWIKWRLDDSSLRFQGWLLKMQFFTLMKPTPKLMIMKPTLGSLEVNAVGSRTKWIGNLSTTSLFSWSMMFTIFLSSLISIYSVIRMRKQFFNDVISPSASRFLKSSPWPGVSSCHQQDTPDHSPETLWRLPGAPGDMSASGLLPHKNISVSLLLSFWWLVADIIVLWRNCLHWSEQK